MKFTIGNNDTVYDLPDNWRDNIAHADNCVFKISSGRASCSCRRRDLVTFLESIEHDIKRPTPVASAPASPQLLSSIL